MKKIYLKFILFFLIINNFNVVKSQFLPTLNLEGKIVAEEQQLTIIYRISEEPNNILVSKLYVPEQMLFGHKASKTELIEDSLIIEIRGLNARYVGTIDYQEGLVRGKHIQHGIKYPLDLKFISNEEAIQFNRPQEPKPPFDYITQEHLIRDNRNNVGINGTLTLPNRLDKFPLVILIHGSGPQDRDQTIAGHKPFLVIADYLTKNGIAVFRYDKRGIGKSSGNYMEATTADFTKDVLNIIRYFKIHKNIDTKNIGLIGHSEGGLIAMKAAAQNRRDIAFIISLAGQAVGGIELLQKQMEDILSAEGENEDFIKKSLSYQKDLFDIALETDNITDLRKEIIKLQEKYSQKLTEQEIVKMGLVENNIDMSVIQMSSPWMKYFLKINPKIYIERLRCPVLAIFGKKDIQVNAYINSKALKKILKDKKNQYYEIHILNNLNHLLQTAQTGKIEEYMLIQETISPEVLNLIKEFIVKDK